MKIAVVGGGPGGLFAALLLKRSDPTREITVLDRNPPDTTYGWGVVFSDETLAFLQEADPDTYAHVANHFVRWDAIDIFHRGTRVRSGGHAFSGLARRELLRILKSGCSSLGVEVLHQVEVENTDQLADFDLVIAADGANSKLRSAQEHSFKPSFDTHGTRYIWFGCQMRLEAFTFVFRPSPGHGMFQVHAYPFDANTSTVIVECSERTWRSAALDVATTEKSIEFCQRLFEAELGGRPLLSNRSSWIRFVTLRNQHWHHGNTVLLGDAAHTAHFSIGSGTKLAMEDAIALNRALGNRTSIRAALVEYEELRQPTVERVQDAARESSMWFEHTDRYAAFEPTQFAFSLLTRSKRITYDSLRMRDTAFANQVDTWFADEAGRTLPATRTGPRRPLENGFRLRGLELSNRLVVAPLVFDGTADATPSLSVRACLVDRAVRGGGLVIARHIAVCADGRITCESSGLYRPAHAESWKEIVSHVHVCSPAAIGVQLTHAGRRGATRPHQYGIDRPLRDKGWPLVSASAIPYSHESVMPRQANRHDMDRIRDSFKQAARYAAMADFDLLEIHMGHGYLLGSFLSPLSNRRTDEYGGDVESRLAFPLEVLTSVRETWPESRPLSVCISVSDWARGGLSITDALVIARSLKACGCDVINVVSGQTTFGANPKFGSAWQTPFSDAVRNSVHIPTIVGGNIASADQVNTILASGRADLCLIRDQEAGDSPLLLPSTQPHSSNR